MRLPRILVLLVGLLPFTAATPASTAATLASATMWTLYRGATVYAAPSPDAGVFTPPTIVQKRR